MRWDVRVLEWSHMCFQIQKHCMIHCMIYTGQYSLRSISQWTGSQCLPLLLLNYTFCTPFSTHLRLSSHTVKHNIQFKRHKQVTKERCDGKINSFSCNSFSSQISCYTETALTVQQLLYRSSPSQADGILWKLIVVRIHGQTLKESLLSENLILRFLTQEILLPLKLCRMMTNDSMKG